MKRSGLRGGVFVAMGWLLARCDQTTVRSCDLMEVCDGWEETTLADRRWSFEADCVGPRCGVVPTAGAPSLGASFHSAERALHLPAGASVQLPVQVEGTPDGARLTFNARCQDGATLLFDGDESTPTSAPSHVMNDGPWRRFVWTLRTPQRAYDLNEDLRAGSSQFLLRFRVTGRGLCVVDQVRYQLQVRACVSSRTVETHCQEVTHTSWRTGGGRTDTGNWPDEGNARVDTGHDAPTPDRPDAADLDAMTPRDATDLDATDAADATDETDADPRD